LRKWGGRAAVFFIFYFQSPTIEITTRLDLNGKTLEWQTGSQTIAILTA
jgi:hypothetical protein